MATATLHDFMALNDQLVALAQAGVPIAVNVGRNSTDPARELEKINAELARRVAQGVPLAEAIESDQALGNPAYRSLVQLGFKSGNLATALDASTQLAENTHDSWNALRLAAINPAVVCVLVYVGLVACCLFFVPTLEAMYRDMRIPTGSGLATLQSLRATLPYWIAIPPLALLLLWAFFRWQSRSAARGRLSPLFAHLPGVARADVDERAANFAGALATLLENGATLSDALRIAAGTWNDRRQQLELELLAAKWKERTPAASDLTDSLRLPPFLRWALVPAETGIEPAQALRMAEGLYRDSARHRVARLRIVAPLLACVAIGGGVTLAYGLVLFVPLVQMIRGLAS